MCVCLPAFGLQSWTKRRMTWSRFNPSWIFLFGDVDKDPRRVGLTKLDIFREKRFKACTATKSFLMNIFVWLYIETSSSGLQICTRHCVVGDSCQIFSCKYFASVTSSLKIEIKRPAVGMHCIVRLARYFRVNTNGPAGLPDCHQLKPSLFLIFPKDYFCCQPE